MRPNSWNALPITRLRSFENPLLNVFDRRAERQQTRILNLEPIVEECDSNWRTTLGVVRVNDGVDHSFA